LFLFIILLVPAQKIQEPNLKLQSLDPGSSQLTLALLKARIFFVNNIQLAFSANYFAVGATFFNRCSNFHIFYFTRSSQLKANG
jgi:hypothetical protein